MENMFKGHFNMFKKSPELEPKSELEFINPIKSEHLK